MTAAVIRQHIREDIAFLKDTFEKADRTLCRAQPKTARDSVAVVHAWGDQIMEAIHRVRCRRIREILYQTIIYEGDLRTAIGVIGALFGDADDKDFPLAWEEGQNGVPYYKGPPTNEGPQKAQH